jgi:ATP-dependent 26S proteasome regulatory subunit
MQVVASAIVDKYIGESARVVREMFGYAKDHQVTTIPLCNSCPCLHLRYAVCY